MPIWYLPVVLYGASDPLVAPLLPATILALEVPPPYLVYELFVEAVALGGDDLEEVIVWTFISSVESEDGGAGEGQSPVGSTSTR